MSDVWCLTNDNKMSANHVNYISDSMDHIAGGEGKSIMLTEKGRTSN